MEVGSTAACYEESFVHSTGHSALLTIDDAVSARRHGSLRQQTEAPVELRSLSGTTTNVECFTLSLSTVAVHLEVKGAGSVRVLSSLRHVPNLIVANLGTLSQNHVRETQCF